MHKITGRQCKTARALLKWNLYDLANRVRSLPARRIESFEKGMVHFMEWENDEMLAVFKKAGIEFHADLEVVLRKDEAQPTEPQGTLGEGARIVLDAEQNVVADSSESRLSGAALVRQLAEEEEEKRRGDPG